MGAHVCTSLSPSFHLWQYPCFHLWQYPLTHEPRCFLSQLPSLAVPASFLASISFASLAVPAFLPCQYQLCFLGSTSSLAAPAASLVVPKLCSPPLHPHAPVATVYGTTTSTTTQRRRSETRRA